MKFEIALERVPPIELIEFIIAFYLNKVKIQRPI